MASESRSRVARVPDILRVLCVLACLCASLSAQQSSSDWAKYEDPRKRFSFLYPSAFGLPEPSGGDGVGDRIAALRFRSLIGTEAVLIRGPVTVERQALGGLYDVFAREIIPENQLAPVLAAITPVTPENFCSLLARTDHLVRPATLSEKALQAARATDQMGNIGPKVILCNRTGATITFDKEAGLGPGAGRRRVYGAIRFLQGAFSAFQVVGFGPPPREDVLAALTAMVESWNVAR